MNKAYLKRNVGKVCKLTEYEHSVIKTQDNLMNYNYYSIKFSCVSVHKIVVVLFCCFFLISAYCDDLL